MKQNEDASSSREGGAIFGLFGVGGFAREVMQFVPAALASYGSAPLGLDQRTYFVDATPSVSECNGCPVVSEKVFLELSCSERFFTVAIADAKVRAKLVGMCLESGVKPLTLISPHALVYGFNEIGEGAIFCAYSSITANSKVGRFFHANPYSYVAHDCVIGDFVTFAPNVHCNGNVHIHDYAYIGSGAMIKHGNPSKPLVIGEGAVVGMGAVVTKDVPPFTTVVGNPARPLVKKK